MPSLKQTYIIASGLAIFLCAFLFYPSATSLDTRWDTNHESYSHGYYLLLAAIVLAIRQWHHIKALPVTPYPLALIPLFGSCFAWLIAHIGHIQVGEQLMLPAIALSLVFLLAGKAIGLRLVFPFLIIYTVIPVWDVLNPTLQYITTTVSSTLLDLFGIAVLIQGNHITIPAGNFVVASGCSGLNYLLMCVFLSLVYNHLYLQRFKQQAIMLTAGILTGLICNWVRVTIIIAIGQITDMQSPMIKDHENLGLVVFGFFTLPLMFLGRSLETETKPVYTPPQSSPTQANWLLWPALACTALSLSNLWYNNETNSNIQTLKIETNRQLNSLQLLPSAKAPWGPAIYNMDISLNHQLISNLGEPHTQVSIRSFLSEEQGKELIHDKNRLTRANWVQTQAGKATSPNGHPVSTRILKQPHTGQQHQLVYWYQIGNSRITDKKWVKPAQIYQALLKRNDATLFAISRPCNISCDLNIEPLLKLSDEITNKVQPLFAKDS